jgi:hypothetical protein
MFARPEMGVGLLRLIFVMLASPSVIAAAEKPNIVLLFADDLGRYASAYADPAKPSPNDIVRTPVFDRIAAEGARFDHAFVSVPSCTPSRGALYTGRHFFRNGSFSQLHSRWAKGAPDPSDSILGMPVALERAGYHIGWSHNRTARFGRVVTNGRQYFRCIRNNGQLTVADTFPATCTNTEFIFIRSGRQIQGNSPNSITIVITHRRSI